MKYSLLVIQAVFLLTTCMATQVKTSDIPVSNSRKWTPLAIALDDCDFELAKRLLEKTDDHTFRGLPLIVFFADDVYNSSAITAFLIKEGINKDFYTEAFVRSVIYDNIDNAQLLLNAGVDISDTIATNSYRIYESGANILHYATSKSMVDFLIKNGADIYNEIMLKNAWKTPNLLHQLEDAGISPFILHDNLNTMLLNAAERGDIQTLEYALKRGAAVNSCQLPPTNKSDRIIDRRIYKQTPLIKNTIQGYRNTEENHNGQISPRVAEILLNAGADPNLVDAEGKTALHYIAGDQWIWAYSEQRQKYMGRRHYEETNLSKPFGPPSQRHDSIALLLIQNDADLNIQDKDGRTPLILAALNHNYKILKMLFDARADITIKDSLGKDVFDYLDNLDAFCTIKEAGLWNHISQEHLNAAFCHFIMSDDQRKKYGVDGLKTLISLGADINTKLHDNGTTALMYTFNQRYGNDIYDIAQVLIDSGIDLYTEKKSGYTVLTDLIKNTNLEEKEAINRLTFLINNGIKLNGKSQNQFTALGIALCQDRKELAGLLIRHGAKRDRESEWWYLISRYFQPDLVTKLQKLVEEGVSVDLQSPAEFIFSGEKVLCQKGITALMIFSHKNKPKIVTALIQMGADVNLKTSEGTTALNLADYREMKDILLQAGAE